MNLRISRCVSISFTHNNSILWMSTRNFTIWSLTFKNIFFNTCTLYISSSYRVTIFTTIIFIIIFRACVSLNIISSCITHLFTCNLSTFLCEFLITNTSPISSHEHFKSSSTCFWRLTLVIHNSKSSIWRILFFSHIC